MHPSRLAVRSDTDFRRLAAVLERAHTRVVDGGEPPPVIRDVVAESWRRSMAAGVDPEAAAPRVFDDSTTQGRFRRHPFGAVFGQVQSRLFRVTRDGDHLAAFSDADGVLLWADGASRMLEAAVRPRFLPGHSCNEVIVGTNAIGTALALDRSVEIFSAEHFTRTLHGWVCAAAPVHHPVSGAVLGALNLSSRARAGNPDTVGLVGALARTVELELAALSATTDERLRARFLRAGSTYRSGAVLANAEARVLLADPPAWIGRQLDRPERPGTLGRLPDGSVARWGPFGSGFVLRRVGGAPSEPRPTIVISQRGHRDVIVRAGDREVRLSPRHSDIILALVQHPGGLSPEALAETVYGRHVSPVTLRAELTRIRRLLGPIVLSAPYRLDADTTAVGPAL